MSTLSATLNWLQKLVLEQLVNTFVLGNPIYIALKSGRYKVTIEKLEDKTTTVN